MAKKSKGTTRKRAASSKYYFGKLNRIKINSVAIYAIKKDI